MARRQNTLASRRADVARRIRNSLALAQISAGTEKKHQAELRPAQKTTRCGRPSPGMRGRTRKLCRPPDRTTPNSASGAAPIYSEGPRRVDRMRMQSTKLTAQGVARARRPLQYLF